MIELECRLLIVYSIGGEGIRLATIELHATLQEGCAEEVGTRALNTRTPIRGFRTAQKI